MSYCMSSVTFQLRNHEEEFSLGINDLIELVHDSLLSSIFLEGESITMNETESKRLISSVEDSYYSLNR